MCDGKRSFKGDVIILSIKPSRPEFSPDKKYVSVKVALQEWDKLDAYYRGEILKLKKRAKSPAHRSSRKSSKSSRKSSASLNELFGDENEPNGNDSVFDYSTQEAERKNDFKEELTLPKKRKLRTESKEKKHTIPEDAEENFLNVPRENFVIQYATGVKKRTSILSSDKGCLSPVIVMPYKPPVAVGLNGIQIHKILYHKGDEHNSPSTTAVITDKPILSPALPTSKRDNEKKSEDPARENTSCDKINSPKLNDPYVRTANIIVGAKRKLVGSESSVSSTTSPKDDFVFKKPGTTDSIVNGKVCNSRCSNFEHDGNNNHQNTVNTKSRTVSITDKIIDKASEPKLAAALSEREKLRRVESDKRKKYAMKKHKEHNRMESVDVSMKAMEMISNYPLLSPIRSP